MNRVIYLDLWSLFCPEVISNKENDWTLERQHGDVSKTSAFLIFISLLCFLPPFQAFHKHVIWIKIIQLLWNHRLKMRVLEQCFLIFNENVNSLWILLKCRFGFHRAGLVWSMRCCICTKLLDAAAAAVPY